MEFTLDDPGWFGIDTAVRDLKEQCAIIHTQKSDPCETTADYLWAKFRQRVPFGYGSDPWVPDLIIDGMLFENKTSGFDDFLDRQLECYLEIQRVMAEARDQKIDVTHAWISGEYGGELVKNSTKPRHLTETDVCATL